MGLFSGRSDINNFWTDVVLHGLHFEKFFSGCVFLTYLSNYFPVGDYEKNKNKRAAEHSR